MYLDRGARMRMVDLCCMYEIRVTCEGTCNDREFKVN